VDLTDEPRVRKLVSDTRPDIIVNAAAVTDVDFCESNPDAAFLANATSVSYLADAGKESNSFLVQVSTDYVFNGDKGTYSENDTPNPINKYGLSKLKGEEAAKRVGEGNWAIGRTSVVYGWGRPHRPNAATYVYDKLSKGERVSMVKDQYSSPTLNTNLARMLLEIAERRITGIIHTSGASRLNRYDFAVQIAQTFGLDTKLISSTDSRSLNWKATRPHDSSLVTSKASGILSNRPLPIDQALEVLAHEHASLVSPENN
jgi:dTDP-4-dehydrorhamnose reductase